MTGPSSCNVRFGYLHARQYCCLRVFLHSPLAITSCFCDPGPHLHLFGAVAFDGTNGSYLSVVFFVVVTMLGMYIVLSLFVSILLERFAGQDLHKFEMEEQMAQVRALQQMSHVYLCSNYSSRHSHHRKPACHPTVDAGGALGLLAQYSEGFHTVALFPCPLCVPAPPTTTTPLSSLLLQMQDLLPEDGRITVTRFDELVATLARTKTQAEKSRKETLKAAIAVRNGNQVPCVATATCPHSP
jgi:hypothetical protein